MHHSLVSFGTAVADVAVPMFHRDQFLAVSTLPELASTGFTRLAKQIGKVLLTLKDFLRPDPLPESA